MKPTMRGGKQKKGTDHYTIHGQNKGHWSVRVLEKPMKGTRQDFIQFYWKSSCKTDGAGWISMTDFEAISLAHMLIWGVMKRNKKCKLEEME